MIKLAKRLQSLAQKYPHVAGLSTVGQSVEGRQLWVMRIARDPDRKSLGKPKFGYVGNMHGNEAVSRQVLVCLLARYGEEERITELVNGTDVCIVPGMSPDGFERSTEGDCSGDHSGRNNAKNKDLNRSFPDQFDKATVDPANIPEVMAVMRWIQEKKSVFLALFVLNTQIPDVFVQLFEVLTRVALIL